MSALSVRTPCGLMRKHLLFYVKGRPDAAYLRKALVSVENPQAVEKILNKLMGPHEGFRIIEPDFFCDYGYNITTGKDFYINHNCVILDCAKVTFGKNVCIGPNCGFYTPEHPLKAEERIKDLEWAKPITIGDNVWLGGNVTVLAGVNIGDNAVIGAGSVVVKDIPSNVVAVGNPCKPIKNIDQ